MVITAGHALGRRVRRLREQRGLSQAELAQRSRISTQYLGEIERGRRDPSLSVATRVAAALDTSLDFLALGEADSPAAIVSAWSKVPLDLRSAALRVLWALSEPEERRVRVARSS